MVYIEWSLVNHIDLEYVWPRFYHLVHFYRLSFVESGKYMAKGFDLIFRHLVSYFRIILGILQFISVYLLGWFETVDNIIDMISLLFIKFYFLFYCHWYSVFLIHFIFELLLLFSKLFALLFILVFFGVQLFFIEFI